MTEEYVSSGFYAAAVADPKVEVLSWQAVDGKGYFAADVKLRMPDGRRFEPDLILQIGDVVWLIEIKGRHSEALTDEAKLAELCGILGDAEVLRQVTVRSGYDVAGCSIATAVSYFNDDLAVDLAEPYDTATVGAPSGCYPGMKHVEWSAAEVELIDVPLSEVLAIL